MPIHDWKKVDAGVFHDFHQRWIIAISESLNSGLLPGEFYALAEQVTGGPIPDVVTLERIDEHDRNTAASQFSIVDIQGSVALADAPPQVKFSHSGELDVYADRATRLAIHHVSGDRVVAYIEIVSPGNKHSEAAIRQFISKLQDAMKSGIHSLVLDLHPPTSRDPRGFHARFWEDSFGDANAPGVSTKQLFSLVAYRSDLVPTAYFQPAGIGEVLIDMPIFLSPDRYVNVPLEASYQQAWRGVPRRWKQVVET